MAKKLNKDELNNVSGGCGGDNGNTSEDPYANCSYAYNCNNEGCKKVLSIQMQF